MAAAQLAFSKELNSFLDAWKTKPGSLIMMLHKIQSEFGYISRESAEQLAVISGIPLAKIYGVMTFYHYFKTVKPGKYTIAVCLGTACYLKGAQDLVDESRKLLKVTAAEATPDGLFNVDPVRCVGCCGLAPVLMVGNEVFGKVSKEQLPKIIEDFRNKK